LRALVRCVLQALRIPHVDSAEAEDFGALSGGRYVFSHAFCFLDIAADDAGVGAEVDEGADLGAADGPGAASAEDDFVCLRDKLVVAHM